MLTMLCIARKQIP